VGQLEREESVLVRQPRRYTETATAALEAENEFAHHWFPEFEHQEIREIEADGIGEESWAVRGGTDSSGFVEIGWRRANAVLRCTSSGSR
jgi:hypothetical protein